MSVLVVVQGILHPERSETLKQYQSVALPIIEKHGGQIVARGTGVESFIGQHQWTVGAVIRFPDVQSARAWHSDPSYQNVIPLRQQAYVQLEINVFQE
jgi:uncharacterized protein (DUF1330 family)